MIQFIQEKKKFYLIILLFFLMKALSSKEPLNHKKLHPPASLVKKNPTDTIQSHSHNTQAPHLQTPDALPKALPKKTLKLPAQNDQAPQPAQSDKKPKKKDTKDSKIKSFLNEQNDFINHIGGMDEKRQKTALQNLNNQGIVKGGLQDTDVMAQEILHFQKGRYNQTWDLDQNDFARIRKEGLLKGILSDILNDTAVFLNDRLIDFEKKNVHLLESRMSVEGFLFQSIKTLIRQQLQKFMPYYLMAYGLMHHEPLSLVMFQALKSYIARKIYAFATGQIKSLLSTALEKTTKTIQDALSKSAPEDHLHISQPHEELQHFSQHENTHKTYDRDAHMSPATEPHNLYQDREQEWYQKKLYNRDHNQWVRREEERD